MIFIGAGALLFAFWISGLLLNLSTQYALNFEYWESGVSSLGICTGVTLLPALVLLYKGLKIRAMARKKRGAHEKK